MNKIFAAYKPIGLSSNQFLGKLKRKYKNKKAGYSGTLDPFAKGVLIVAFGSYTKLFRFLKKTPKAYRATMWLGAYSSTLDIEKIDKVELLEELDIKKVKSVIKAFEGGLEYLPPKYSAKKIDGKRAYDLARGGEDFKMKSVKSHIYSVELISYSHPFVTFEAVVSEGTYIRSLADLISKSLGYSSGVLSYLERLYEGVFKYEKEKSLDIKDILDMEKNIYLGSSIDIEFGRKLSLENFRIKEDGIYYIENVDSISIIEINDSEVKYLLNKIGMDEC